MKFIGLHSRKKKNQCVWPGAYRLVEGKPDEDSSDNHSNVI